MKHPEWLIQQLDQWQRDGVVSEESASKLRTWAERELKSDSGGSKAAQVLVGGLGALMVGAGPLAIIAHNWDMIPRGARLAGSFALMALAQLFLAWTLKRGKRAAGWVKEVAAMLVVLTVGGCLAMVSQIYSLGGSWTTLLLVWVIIVSPVLWVTFSYSAALFHLVASATWALAEGADFVGRGDSWWFLVLLALFLPWWPGWKLSRKVLPSGMRWAVTLAVLAGFLAMTFDSAALHDSEASAWWGAMLVACVLLLFPLNEAGSREGLMRKPQVFVGGWMLLGLAFTHGISIGEYATVSKSIAAALSQLWCQLLLAVAVGFAVMAVRARRWGVLAVATLALTPVLAAVADGDSDALSWLFTAHLFLIGVALIGAEFVGRPGAPRLGAMIIAIIILMRMADSELPLLLKAVLFILIGIGFIVFNVMWGRGAKALAQQATEVQS